MACTPFMASSLVMGDLAAPFLAANCLTQNVRIVSPPAKSSAGMRLLARSCSCLCCIASGDASFKHCEHFAFIHLFHEIDMFIIVSEVHTIKDFTDDVCPCNVVLHGFECHQLPTL
jgi:hypothetical protein